ncbi:hypothetical protein NEOLEDRAFT_708006 [Neolentinus lepideus HHB14362 ss-1]|uniref:Uncharacterized protein n=1 Tax=Neolentinus lepideus HHB14362 ss-1 TaxID=1314782 RepID=A0A165Q719_9AGAM|nr:hypothetical protein NEOLEDRAFT_708006 [Neolentinus lepideus HHB14362 ss-1]
MITVLTSSPLFSVCHLSSHPCPAYEPRPADSLPPCLSAAPWGCPPACAATAETAQKMPRAGDFRVWAAFSRWLSILIISYSPCVERVRNCEPPGNRRESAVCPNNRIIYSARISMRH